MLGTTGLEIVDANPSCLPQCFKAYAIFDFAAFDEPKPFTQDLAGILVAAGVDEPFDQVRLMFRQDDVACRD